MDSRIWMVELPVTQHSVFNCESANFRVVDDEQLFYSLINAYDPKEAIVEAKRVFIHHIKNSIL